MPQNIKEYSCSIIQKKTKDLRNFNASCFFLYYIVAFQGLLNYSVESALKKHRAIFSVMDQSHRKSE